MHTDESRISAVHAFGDDFIHMHDISTLKTMEFAPLLNILQKIFPGDPWKDTELRRQAVHEDLANGLIKGTHVVSGTRAPQSQLQTRNSKTT